MGGEMPIWGLPPKLLHPERSSVEQNSTSLDVRVSISRTTFGDLMQVNVSHVSRGIQYGVNRDRRLVTSTLVTSHHDCRGSCVTYSETLCLWGEIENPRQN